MPNGFSFLNQSRLHLCALSLITTVEEEPRCNWGDQSRKATYPSLVTVYHLYMFVQGHQL